MSHSIFDAASLPGVPTLHASGAWTTVFEGATRQTLEAALPLFVTPRRWFGSKTRVIRDIRIGEALPILPAAWLALLRVSYAAGDPETYVLPVGFVAGAPAQALARERPSAVIAALQAGQESGLLYDALWDPGFCEALLEIIREGRRFAGVTGDLVASPGRALQRLRGDPAQSLPPVLLGVEQSNTSVRYGDRLILKLYRRLEAGVNPDQEIGQYLTEKAGFAHVPPLAGVLEFHPRAAGGAAAITVALLQGFVPNHGDAWRYTLDALAGYFVAARSQDGVNLESPELPRDPLLELVRGKIPPQAERRIGAYLDSARLLARRTAELHLALAADPADPIFAPEPFSPEFQGYLQRDMRGLTERTMRSLQARLEGLSEDDQRTAREVLALEGQILTRFDTLLAHPIHASRLRIHGDYHLGQVLYTGADFMLIDFEGEPARPLNERRMKRSALQDVAGMLRSFHYAAYAAYFAQVEAGASASPLEAWARYWHLWVSVAYLKAYLEVANGASFLPGAPAELALLLDTHLVEKAVYELGYELNNRPGWARIPLQGILQTVQAGG